MIWLAMKLLIKLQNFQKSSLQNNSETVTSEHDKEIPKERYVSKEEGRELVDELKLKQ